MFTVDEKTKKQIYNEMINFNSSLTIAELLEIDTFYLESTYDYIQKISSSSFDYYKLIYRKKDYDRIDTAIKLIESYFTILDITKNRKMKKEARENIKHLVKYDIIETVKSYKI